MRAITLSLAAILTLISLPAFSLSWRQTVQCDAVNKKSCTTATLPDKPDESKFSAKFRGSIYNKRKQTYSALGYTFQAWNAKGNQIAEIHFNDNIEHTIDLKRQSGAYAKISTKKKLFFLTAPFETTSMSIALTGECDDVILTPNYHFCDQIVTSDK